MTSILLTTLNARFTHCAFGLRYLLANLGDLVGHAAIEEFTIAQNPREIVEKILKHQPSIVGFGVYIWNTIQTREVIAILKQLRPNVKIVLGGPEVSHETRAQPICQLADLTIQGEADDLFRLVCQEYLETGVWPAENVLFGPLPDVKTIRMPYRLYTDSDIQNRILYVEASRGCPYKCEYCLSSLDKSVRSFDTDAFLLEMASLIQRGGRQFKFVDRTFNLSIATSVKILQFFLDHSALGLFIHFEMVPDRLPLELRELIRLFPPGALQFEIGIQTWNPEVARLVSRRLDRNKTSENFTFLTQSTGVHLHADLIAGLPGETLESFATGFDAVAALRPHEIQVGILKRLRGTSISRHDESWGMRYQDTAPYTVIQTGAMSFENLQDVTRFSNFWNLIANSGNFVKTSALLRELSERRLSPSFFWQFWELMEFLNTRHSQGHGISLIHLVESIWEYLKGKPELELERVRLALIEDYTRPTSRDVPRFLHAFFKPEAAAHPQAKGSVSALPKRQRRHMPSQGT